MRLLASASLVALFLFAAHDAAAQEGAPRATKDQETRTIAVTLNPLAFVVGRYGGNVEIVAARHHAFVASGWIDTFPTALVRDMLPPEARDRVRDAPISAGGEIGWRLYTASHGAEGLFVGPSLVFTPLVYPRLTPDEHVELVTFHAPGAALDIGAQTVTSFGLTLGGGLGVEYLAYSLPNDPQRLPLDLAPHWLPRVLASAGWSF
ncbi:MAG TPA: hypothetical protein VIF62_38605 [Labilithrix sp.]